MPIPAVARHRSSFEHRPALAGFHDDGVDVRVLVGVGARECPDREDHGFAAGQCAGPAMRALTLCERRQRHLLATLSGHPDQWRRRIRREHQHVVVSPRQPSNVARAADGDCAAVNGRLPDGAGGIERDPLSVRRHDRVRSALAVRYRAERDVLPRPHVDGVDAIRDRRKRDRRSIGGNGDDRPEDQVQGGVLWRRDVEPGQRARSRLGSAHERQQQQDRTHRQHDGRRSKGRNEPRSRRRPCDRPRECHLLSLERPLENQPRLSDVAQPLSGVLLEAATQERLDSGRRRRGQRRPVRLVREDRRQHVRHRRTVEGP